MKLTKRDKAIIEDLNKFRVADRDSIATLHFSDLKNPTKAVNNVLLRLVRENQIQRSKAFTPYLYFGPDVNMKKNSAKIGHFLAILNVYKEILQHGKVDQFLVEPKYGNKGTVEPDVFCIFKRTPFFIEVQKTVYSDKQMNEKLERYVALYNSGVIAGEPWQPQGKPLFPHVLIVSEQRYGIGNEYPFKVLQAPSFTHFMQSLKPKDAGKPPEPQKIISNNGVIKINLN